MKAIILLGLIALVVTISGLVPYQATQIGSECDWQIQANDNVCRPKAYTWWYNGWLVQRVTGCTLLGWSCLGH